MKNKMLGTITVIASLILSCFALATNANKTSTIIKNKDSLKAMTKIMPEEFKNYEKQLKKDYGISDANLTLSFVSKAYDLRKNNSDPNKQEDLNRTYRTTWLLCTGLFQKTKDTEVKKIVLNNWNTYLKKDDKFAQYQIYAIAYEGADRSRSFLTEDFWNLLEHTKNKKTILAICNVVEQCGNKEDANHLSLIEKKRSGDEQGIIQLTLSWMEYRFRNDKTDPGPSRPLPGISFKDDDQKPNSKSVQK
jgi:hypothetical protein